MPTRVKICGITRVDDALVAARAGADAIGLIFYPGSKRCISVARACEIVQALPPFVTTVALFVDPVENEVRDVLERVQPDLLQFHGAEPAEFCARFSRPWLKAVRVRPGVDLLQCATEYAGARALLLDAYVAGQAGGTGQSFDWSLIPRSLSAPVVLSGGLTPENVHHAVRAVRPAAVDVSSGVESVPGIKDAAKISAFLRGVANADG